MIRESVHPVVCGSCGQPLGSCGCGKNDYVLNREFGANTQTSEGLLKSFSGMFNLISREIDLLVPGDSRELALLRLRAELISQLPSVMRTVSDFATVDKELLSGVAGIGFEAEQAIQIGPPGNFGERVLLTSRGSKLGDPNHLDRLIMEFFPE